MNTTPSEVIATFLRNADIGTVPSAGGEWPIYETRLPDGQNVKSDVMAVIDTAGDKKARLMNGEVITDRGIQVLIRSAVFKTGWVKAELIARFLDIIGSTDVIVDSETYTINACRRTSDIVNMGQEPNDQERHMLSINYLVSFKATFSDLYTEEVKSILAANTYNANGTINSTEELHELVNSILP